MKETPLSTCERNFIIQAIKQNQRLDGRKNDEFRPIKINYGADWGSVLVALGETKVIAQVSSELGVPKAVRPNEGMLHINVELGPMAAPHFEAGRNSELTVQLNRTLERTFKESRCLDLESLCIQSEERVWILRVDLNVLNHEGNLFDCCSVATLCALMHFRRPEVSLVEDDVVIHTEAEKEPLPMVMHHYPVCVSYCTFDDGRIAVADPTIMEERTSESQMIFGINSFRELCCLNLGGSSLTSSTLLLQSSKRASNQAKKVVDLVKQTLENDLAARENRSNVGFTECLRQNTITSLAEDRLVLKLRHFTFNDVEETDEQRRKNEFFKNLADKADDDDDDDSEGEITLESMNAAKTTSGDVKKSTNDTKWMPEEVNDANMESATSSEEEEVLERSTKVIEQPKASKNKSASKNKPKAKKATAQRNTDSTSDSEEEEQVVL
ncbi:exosome complex component RRP45 isoform X2 [Lucilia sericata]|uniref:exosome complex component RRP45 isoform X2 n=1 Tax=Lucilia sericata TaxID=13632 RepID=UPI0018A7F29A|nr:exosome complex component RRP45 isoform X2 [Lucilia sericata]